MMFMLFASARDVWGTQSILSFRKSQKGEAWVVSAGIWGKPAGKFYNKKTFLIAVIPRAFGKWVGTRLQRRAAPGLRRRRHALGRLVVHAAATGAWPEGQLSWQQVDCGGKLKVEVLLSRLGLSSPPTPTSGTSQREFRGAPGPEEGVDVDTVLVPVWGPGLLVLSVQEP